MLKLELIENKLKDFLGCGILISITPSETLRMFIFKLLFLQKLSRHSKK